MDRDGHRVRSIVDPMCDWDEHMAMAESGSKSLRAPEETIRLPRITEELVDLGDLTVGRTVQEPGWRWSTHTRPVVGGEWCRARHVGVVLSGRFGVLLQDGTVLELGPDDVYDIASEHDGYTIGDEPWVVVGTARLRFKGLPGEWRLFAHVEGAQAPLR